MKQKVIRVREKVYYHSLLLLWLNFLGFEPQGEISTNIGVIDAIWKSSDITVITEVKYSDKKNSCPTT
ncbi:MAG: PD-(D/E)XK nuclease domain-containing protein [Planctomycetaceae bacterium]|nr:PD-(D/E)XK nuclease domain-containing protein [Planctomycetaceae bacterium]